MQAHLAWSLPAVIAFSALALLLALAREHSHQQIVQAVRA
jgi:hypothetical protein